MRLWRHMCANFRSARLRRRRIRQERLLRSNNRFNRHRADAPGASPYVAAGVRSWDADATGVVTFMLALKAFGIWLLILACAFLNGTLREILLVPKLGNPAAL